MSSQLFIPYVFTQQKGQESSLGSFILNLFLFFIIFPRLIDVIEL